jgi:hypothetical protein
MQQMPDNVHPGVIKLAKRMHSIEDGNDPSLLISPEWRRLPRDQRDLFIRMADLATAAMAQQLLDTLDYQSITKPKKKTEI